MRLAVCAALVTYVVMALSWYDQVHLVNGTEGRLLSVSETSRETTLRVDGHAITVPDADVESIEPGLVSLVKSASPREALLAILLALPAPFVGAYRLYLLLIGLDLKIARARAMGISLVGNLVQLAMPGATGADIYRGIMLRRWTGSWRPVLVALLTDRILGLLALLVLAGVAAAIWINDAEFAGIARGVLAACVAGSLAIYLVLRFRLYRLVLRLLRLFRKDPAVTSDGMIAIGERLLEKNRVLTHTFVLSLIVQALIVASTAAIGISLGIDHAVEAAALIIPTAMVLAIFIPTPQGFGVLEGVLVLVLAPHIAGGANACVLLALGFRFLQVVWAIPGVPLILSGDTWSASRGETTTGP